MVTEVCGGTAAMAGTGGGQTTEGGGQGAAKQGGGGWDREGGVMGGSNLSKGRGSRQVPAMPATPAPCVLLACSKTLNPKPKP